LADEKFTQANPNTNAQESVGRTLQLSSEQERPSIKDAFYHCYRFALKCGVQYVNAKKGSRVIMDYQGIEKSLILMMGYRWNIDATQRSKRS
jgi:hypothetical protein